MKHNPLFFSQTTLLCIVNVYHQEFAASPAAAAGHKIQSVSVRVSGDGVAFRTKPFHVKQLGGATCAPQWQEGNRTLRLNHDTSHLRADILAALEPPRDALATATCPAKTETVFATACLDLAATKSGYNYVQLFSPVIGESDSSSSSTSTGHTMAMDGPYEGQVAAAARLMGQVVLRLAWVEPGEGRWEEGGHGEKREHVVFLVVQGASGLAKADM